MVRRDGANRALQGRTAQTGFSAPRVNLVTKLTPFHRVHRVPMENILRMESVWTALWESTPVWTKSSVWFVQQVNIRMAQDALVVPRATNRWPLLHKA